MGSDEACILFWASELLLSIYRGLLIAGIAARENVNSPGLNDS